MQSLERLLCVQLIPLTLSSSRKMDGDETNGNMFVFAEEGSDCGRTLLVVRGGVFVAPMLSCQR